MSLADSGPSSVNSDLLTSKTFSYQTAKTSGTVWSPPPPSAYPLSTPPTRRNSKYWIGFGVVVLLILVVICWLRRKRRRVGLPKPPYQRTSAELSDGNYERQLYLEAGGIELGNQLLSFTPEQIREMTDGFSTQNLIGEGGFATVYRGSLPDGRAIAVKQLKTGTKQGEQEFKAEINIISRVHHQNLVTLVGYCCAQDHRTLIFQYVPNNNLSHHLHGDTVLSWENRMKVAIGVARALSYLHYDCHPKIIHRDIKPANILLDDSFEAQVADFGLAKLKNDTDSNFLTAAAGTFGYMPPEYATGGKLSEKADVYSYGVLLLELLTGRKAIDRAQPDQDEGLVSWANPRLQAALDEGDFSPLTDPRLEGRYVESEMRKMAQAAGACVHFSSKGRPSMAQVLNVLDIKREPDLNYTVQHGERSSSSAKRYSMFRRTVFGSPNRSDCEMSTLSSTSQPGESSSAEFSRTESEDHPMLD